MEINWMNQMEYKVRRLSEAQKKQFARVPKNKGMLPKGHIISFESMLPEYTLSRQQIDAIQNDTSQSTLAVLWIGIIGIGGLLWGMMTDNLLLASVIILATLAIVFYMLVNYNKSKETFKTGRYSAYLGTVEEKCFYEPTLADSLMRTGEDSGENPAYYFKAATVYIEVEKSLYEMLMPGSNVILVLIQGEGRTFLWVLIP